MTIPIALTFTGASKEFQFRDQFVMPLLLRLGFGIVVNYHGQREFGRDVVFGDIDRFGHVVYYGMQIKYESSISLGDSDDLILDAVQATTNPFQHPQTGRQESISCFYVANAGSISDPGRENFFNSLIRRGVRDARLLDGNSLVLLDKAASLRRNADIKERLTGMIQEVRRNKSICNTLIPLLEPYIRKEGPYPMHRLRNTACSAYLTAPFSMPLITVDQVDRYWEAVRMVSDAVDSLGIPVVPDEWRQQRCNGILNELIPQVLVLGDPIETSASNC